jgi:flagellar basal body-associated protein FliL
MARKVKLDILETRGEDGSAVEAGLPATPGAASEIPQTSGGWQYKKWILLGTIAIGFCLTAAGALFFLAAAGKNDVASTPRNEAEVVLAGTTPRTMANFGNFVIDYRQQGGGFRIVVFAFTVEFNAPMNGDAVQDHADLREAIYTLSKKRTAVSLAAPEERGSFKKEIAAEVEKRLGTGVVKEIYFTKFCVL